MINDSCSLFILKITVEKLPFTLIIKSSFTLIICNVEISDFINVCIKSDISVIEISEKYWPEYFLECLYASSTSSGNSTT